MSMLSSSCVKVILIITHYSPELLLGLIPNEIHDHDEIYTNGFDWLFSFSS